jgi:Cytochrome c554 and c-prime
MRRAPAALVLVPLLVGLVAAADDFVTRHWRQPLAPQGPPPPRFTPLEASLQPEACGTCHPVQHADWRTSLHAASMGPGVTGQLREMVDKDPRSALECQNCHAPLFEQRPLVGKDGGVAPNPAFDATLRRKGIPCAACHVRQHERFGPPRRDGGTASAVPRENLPHHGATRTPAFLASEFCRGCHQFTDDGFALNGKLLENTYREWSASRFAAAGVQCQDCHMPDRRHLWRGIHDAEMVRSGITIKLDAAKLDAAAPSWSGGDRVVGTLSVTNTGVGHAFPTYVTPRVVLRGELLDVDGQVVPGSRQETAIARDVTLDLAAEVSDTRLLPGETAVLEYRRRPGAPGGRVRFSVVVYPDWFYTRFFDALLRQGAGRGAAEISEALSATRRSSFTVFAQDVALE